MRARFLAGILAAALFAPAASAEGPVSYALSFPTVTWKPDEVSQLSGRLGFQVVYSPEFGKEDALTKRHHNDAWIASLRADAVDRDGVITKAVASFDSGLVLPQGASQAEQFGGVRIELLNGRWTDAGGQSAPPRAAGRWLTDRFAKDCMRENRLEWLGAFEPGRQVAPGDEWKPDLEALAKHYSRTWDMQLDAKGAEGTCKFETAAEVKFKQKERVVSLWVQMSFPVRQAPKDGRGRRHPVSKDTRLEMTVQLHLGLGDHLPYREIVSSAHYSQRDAKGDGSWTTNLHAWWGVKNDGWVPEPKK